MISVRRGLVARLAATAVATALFAGGALATAGTAAADEDNSPRSGGATATLKKLETYDTVKVAHRGGSYNAGLFTMDVDGGGTIKTYCIDFGTSAKTNHKYQETGWGNSSLAEKPEQAGKIHWILQNSYPQVDDLAGLAEKAGANSLTAEQAAAGTQAAIWHFSDNVDATPTNKDAEKLADWLRDSAQVVGEPEAPSLALEPNQVGAVAGEKAGPVKVRTSASGATVTTAPDAASQGVSVVDAAGNIVDGTSVVDGTELFFDVPADAAPGSASLSASVSTPVSVGRVFTGINTVTQTMILAGSTESSVTAGATANWVEAETEEPLPSVTASEDCVAGGVAVTVTNNGTQDYSFDLDGQELVVAPGESGTITVPVENKQGYEIVVFDEDGTTEIERFEGVLDCQSDSEGEGPEESTGDDEPESNEPTPDGDSEEPNLAETGSSSNVGMIAGIAIALLVAGGAAVLFFRKKAKA
ncbi:thioester domain-containing protein [Streptomyces spiramenti]|uniref:Cys-Gln thioester bond-forming surface protein n=1 Tax=Streptomyces spiramenti TaxID=2720606 RepID=A0ABX1AG90_9ACTN|nr:thioester domain-containing protein [Streptomyces spiramenti]NJP64894.1 Cys-Gln thioester bond-forming surface protein [Streptomyces spiramenti]